MKSSATLLALAFLLTMSAGPFGQDSADKAASRPCGQPEVSQFDFWLGEWQVLFDGLYRRPANEPTKGGQ